VQRLRDKGCLAIPIPMLLLATVAWAQAVPSETPVAPGQGSSAASAASDSDSGFDVLVGRWVRPDGGYTITIHGVEADGTLDAGYANPSPLPFSKAVASRDGKTIQVFLELRAGGYDGSTYTLRYDPGKDVLEGVYYQAVAQQRYDIFFERVE
jgi:hypothetical protein